MTTRTRTIRRTHIHAAHTTNRALGYRTLSGMVAALVETGRLVRTGDFLKRIGGGDLPDGQQSWFGRHAKKAYIAANGTEPLKVWARHRTTGKFIHVHVYNPIDEALYTGLQTYKATRHLLAETYARCA